MYDKIESIQEKTIFLSKKKKNSLLNYRSSVKVSEKNENLVVQSGLLGVRRGKK